MINRTKMLIRMLGESITNIDSYVDELLTRKYVSFESMDQVNSLLGDYISSFKSNCPLNSAENIRYYTGYLFKDINAVLRGNWNYENNGILTDEKNKECKEVADNVSNSFNYLPSSLPTNINTYRGVGLAAFKEFGINSVEEMEKMNGQYFYESGFTSTSFVKSTSFFDRDLEYHDDCEVEIEYYIPEECQDGLPLTNDYLSYSASQNEFLIDKGSLIKIFDVKVENGKAHLKAAFIPRKKWDLEYLKEQEKSK